MPVDIWLRDGDRTPSSFFSAVDLDAVRTFYAGLPNAGPTPLHRLPHLAAALGIGELLVKDESQRFGLPAFKIAGARYAISKLVARERGLRHVACATAGNHGRAVARAAFAAGLEAHVYVPIGTAPSRIAALRSEGAHVVVTSAGYDGTVRLMAADASGLGWSIVSDTAWEGYEEIPRWIMAGYTQIMNEAAGAWGPAPPDVVVVQAGVGSLAGSVAAWLDARFGSGRPRLVTVEPDGSACLVASLRAGQPTALPSCGPTAMVGLRCAEVSPLAWRALAPAVDAAMAIDDGLAAEAIARLERPNADDPAVVAGASGAAGVGALIALSRRPELHDARGALKLSTSSRVLAIVTEGPTQLSA
jgi:diaminopropionate ammonia-lyase